MRRRKYTIEWNGVLIPHLSCSYEHWVLVLLLRGHHPCLVRSSSIEGAGSSQDS